MTGDKYYGTKATINAWKPQVHEQVEFSMSQLLILGGNARAELNSIEAGWMVYLLFNFIITFFSFRPLQNIELLIIFIFTKITCV